MRGLLLACLLLAAFAALRAADPPVVDRRCTDLTGTIAPGELRALEEKLRAFEQETSNQVVVIMVASTEGDPVEDYTLRAAEANKLGKKGRNNGVLLFIAKDDRQMRIEVGYGLEGVLTDALCSQIIRRVIGPRFREGDYAGGVDAGVDAIIAATKGEFTGDGEDGGKRGGLVRLLIIIFIIVMLILSSGFRRRRNYIGSRGTWGGFGGGGFGGGGFGGGGFGGGGFGGGGFSGGGGSFGGGGASGSW